MKSFDYLADRLDALAEQHRLRRLVPRNVMGASLLDASCDSLINFGGNDYLGLAANLTTAEIATGSTSSALVCGWTVLHEQLAQRLAVLESTEAAVLFPSGYAACSGTIATLAEPGDLILSDQLNHASLIDGCRLSAAECVVYPHRDFHFVADVLAKQRERFHRVWIVTDGVFSMDGHIAPLVELCDVADRFETHMVVDEAHGTGVLGRSGSGVCEALGVKHRVAIRIGTLSKAVGCQGGFVAGPKLVVDYLINRCRSLIFSTALAPAAVMASMTAIESFERESHRRVRVQRLARELRRRLSLRASCDLEASVPIVPIVLGDDRHTMEVSARLARAGYFVPAIRPPTVPPGTSRLRISLSALHTDAMLDGLIDTLSNLMKRSE
ncbi:aminotransferase class I/II-fold pyridoxal phosphate-dependent enzyme [Novipirellula artificiosorum]|uniref:8-amino-7-oxononanoate synthase n=1 Tax=Novipirellula artificiosorum TaxID=2528016 RepID=A0A5C6DWW9_9BACT|nr:8-amino-7-oxononanoate synthase [Novipirellula artificiosorum]TWU40704.1 8-amino-7-oxononanoate synthase [Novipirellula artificiosorum]